MDLMLGYEPLTPRLLGALHWLLRAKKKERHSDVISQLLLDGEPAELDRDLRRLEAMKLAYRDVNKCSDVWDVTVRGRLVLREHRRA